MLWKPRISWNYAYFLTQLVEIAPYLNNRALLFCRVSKPVEPIHRRPAPSKTIILFYLNVHTSGWLAFSLRSYQHSC